MILKIISINTCGNDSPLTFGWTFGFPSRNDQTAWQQLSDTQQQAITRMLAGTSMLAVYQSEVGTPAIRHDRRNSTRRIRIKHHYLYEISPCQKLYDHFPGSDSG